MGFSRMNGDTYGEQTEADGADELADGDCSWHCGWWRAVTLSRCRGLLIIRWVYVSGKKVDWNGRLV